MTDKMMGYEYIAKTLEGQGIDHIFYVEAMLKYVLRDMKNAKRVMAHSENAAAYMADGYARMSGKPGLMLSQAIGAGNTVGGVHEAWLANSPVIAITGKKPPVYQYRGAYQEADHKLMFEAITKFNADVTDTNQLPVVLRQCFRASVTGKPRPVHVDMTNHFGRVTEMGSVDKPVFLEPTYTKYPAFRPAAPEDLVAEAAAKIDAAERPIIVIGRGAAISGAGEAIEKLAARADIPMVTTPDGKTLINEDDARWTGIVGEYGLDCANHSVQESDLVIFIGTQTGDQTTLHWKVPAMETPVVQIDIDPIELGKNYPNCTGLPGDARTVVEQLAEAVKENTHEEWTSLCAKRVKETLAKYEDLMNSDDTPIHTERLCKEISEALPDDAVLVSDTGYAAVWSATLLRMKKSQKYIRAAGSLGWGLPGAMGVKCATDRPVVCFTGDAGLSYYISEYETAVRCGINFVTVINNNSCLLQIAPDMNQVYGDDIEGAKERYTYPDIDYCGVAASYGCWTKKVEDPADIGPAIKEALACGRPAVIDVRTSADATVPATL